MASKVEELNAKIEKCKRNLAKSAKAAKERGRFTVRFNDRTVVEGQVYTPGDVAGFEKEVYKKVLARGKGEDFVKSETEKLAALKKEKEKAEKAEEKPKPRATAPSTPPRTTATSSPS